MPEKTANHSSIQYSIVWTLPQGKADEFKKLVAEAVEIARNKSPVTSYHWYFNEDESRCGLIEVYPDPSAIVPHLSVVGDVLTKMLSISKISRFDVFGSLDTDTRERIMNMGARLYLPWRGFTR